MPTATETEQTTGMVTFTSRSVNQILTRRPPRNETNEFGQKTVVTEEEWFDRQKESGEDFDDTPWKVEFVNYEFQTDHPKLLRWLRQHDKLGVNAPGGFWEDSPTEDQLRPTTAEQHLAIARASGDANALLAIRDAERDTHNRSAVIEAAEMAVSVIGEGLRAGDRCGTRRRRSPIDLAALRTRLDTFDGFDLTSSEAAELINEARRELALRSRYPRKVEDIGPTVAAQASYDWPDDLLVPVSLRVNGVPYTPSDRDTVQQIERGELIHRGTGLYYEQADDTGARKVFLYPAPTEAGQEIELEWVYRPEPLSEDSDEPTEIPEEFHAKLLHFVAATYYRTSEDNPELATYNSEKADLAVSELTRYENLRVSGEGPWQVGISGVTA